MHLEIATFCFSSTSTDKVGMRAYAIRGPGTQRPSEGILEIAKEALEAHPQYESKASFEAGAPIGWPGGLSFGKTLIDIRGAESMQLFYAYDNYLEPLLSDKGFSFCRCNPYWALVLSDNPREWLFDAGLRSMCEHALLSIEIEGSFAPPDAKRL